MNILFVTGIFAKNELDTILGGMPRAVFKSALGMKNRGHKVRILTVSDRQRRWRYQSIDVISVRNTYRRIESNIIDEFLNIVGREYCIEKNVQKLNAEDKIDIIQYTGWFGIGLFHMQNIPAVMRVSSYTKVQLSSNYSIAERILFELVEYLAARRMNFVFAPSRITAEGLQRDIKRRVEVIETPFYKDEVEQDDAILQTKLRGKKYILYFGRMSIDKGILVVRDIIYPLLKKYVNLNFVFAGSSSKYNGEPIEYVLSNSAKVYKDRVIFLGMLSQEKLVPVIKAAEMILMPSLADNLPNACAEAMALGKIVIGTDGSSLEQFITNGKNGFLTRIGSSDELIKCIEHVLNLSDEQKVIISQNAIQRIKSFDLDMYSSRMENIYAKVINLVKYKNKRSQ